MHWRLNKIRRMVIKFSTNSSWGRCWQTPMLWTFVFLKAGSDPINEKLSKLYTWLVLCTLIGWKLISSQSYWSKLVWYVLNIFLIRLDCSFHCRFITTKMSIISDKNFYGFGNSDRSKYLKSHIFIFNTTFSVLSNLWPIL